MSEQTQDHTSIFIPDDGVLEAVEQVAADDVANGPIESSNAATQISEGDVIEMTSVVNSVLTIIMDHATSGPEGGTDSDSGDNIYSEVENVPTHEKVIQVVARTIKAVGALTMAVVMHAAYSELASGVVIGPSMIAYNVTLALIFALGLGEFITGFWVSMSDSLTYKRRLWIGGIVLFLSISLLVGIHTGGFA